MLLLLRLFACLIMLLRGVLPWTYDEQQFLMYVCVHFFTSLSSLSDARIVIFGFMDVRMFVQLHLPYIM